MILRSNSRQVKNTPKYHLFVYRHTPRKHNHNKAHLHCEQHQRRTPSQEFHPRLHGEPHLQGAAISLALAYCAHTSTRPAHPRPQFKHPRAPASSLGPYPRSPVPWHPSRCPLSSGSPEPYLWPWVLIPGSWVSRAPSPVPGLPGSLSPVPGLLGPLSAVPSLRASRNFFFLGPPIPLPLVPDPGLPGTLSPVPGLLGTLATVPGLPGSVSLAPGLLGPLSFDPKLPGSWIFCFASGLWPLGTGPHAPWALVTLQFPSASLYLRRLPCCRLQPRQVPIKPSGLPAAGHHPSSLPR